MAALWSFHQVRRWTPPVLPVPRLPPRGRGHRTSPRPGRPRPRPRQRRPLGASRPKPRASLGAAGPGARRRQGAEPKGGLHPAAGRLGVGVPHGHALSGGEIKQSHLPQILGRARIETQVSGVPVGVLSQSCTSQPRLAPGPSLAPHSPSLRPPGWPDAIPKLSRRKHRRPPPRMRSLARGGRGGARRPQTGSPSAAS